MTEVTKLGTILDETAQRDAIHIAVAPVVAAHMLEPGEHVGFVNEGDTETVGRVLKRIGIVDPFLGAVVMPGQRFWLFLYPQTITSLRHNWTHPAFGAEQAKPDGYAESEKWMRDFADQYGFAPSRMIEAGKEWIRSGERFCDGGTFEGERVPDEYWIHFERLTGQAVAAHDRENFFTCSC